MTKYKNPPRSRLRQPGQHNEDFYRQNVVIKKEDVEDQELNSKDVENQESNSKEHQTGITQDPQNSNSESDVKTESKETDKKSEQAQKKKQDLQTPNKTVQDSWKDVTSRHRTRSQTAQANVNNAVKSPTGSPPDKKSRTNNSFDSLRSDSEHSVQTTVTANGSAAENANSKTEHHKQANGPTAKNTNSKRGQKQTYSAKKKKQQQSSSTKKGKGKTPDFR